MGSGGGRGGKPKVSSSLKQLRAPIIPLRTFFKGSEVNNTVNFFRSHTGIRASAGSGSYTVKTSILSALKPSTSSISCCDTTTLSVSQPEKPWTTRTSVSTPYFCKYILPYFCKYSRTFVSTRVYATRAQCAPVLKCCADPSRDQDPGVAHDNDERRHGHDSTRPS